MKHKSITKEKKEQSEEMRSEQIASSRKAKKFPRSKTEPDQISKESSQRKVENDLEESEPLGFSLDLEEDEEE